VASHCTFDAVYATAVTYHFGVAMDDILKRWEDTFDLDGPTKTAQIDDKRRCHQADAEKYNKQKAARRRRNEERNERRGISGGFDTFDVLMASDVSVYCGASRASEGLLERV
jgi:hypothetical protein